MYYVRPSNTFEIKISDFVGYGFIITVFVFFMVVASYFVGQSNGYDKISARIFAATKEPVAKPVRIPEINVLLVKHDNRYKLFQISKLQGERNGK